MSAHQVSVRGVRRGKRLVCRDCSNSVARDSPESLNLRTKGAIPPGCPVALLPQPPQPVGMRAA